MIILLALKNRYESFKKYTFYFVSGCLGSLIVPPIVSLFSGFLPGRSYNKFSVIMGFLVGILCYHDPDNIKKMFESLTPCNSTIKYDNNRNYQNDNIKSTYLPMIYRDRPVYDYNQRRWVSTWTYQT